MRLLGNERKYVEEVLSYEFKASKSGFMVSRLERAFADRFGVPHAIALCNGTATLHAILAALGVGSGDNVIVPALTMASTSLAVLHAGAIPVWADVCEDSWCIDPESIRRLIDDRTRAIITVALYGMPPDMDRILEAAQGIPVIEDDAQCIGGYYKERLAGTIGKAASFSFQSSKTLTAGEGGIVGTSDAELADRVRSFSNLGYKSGFTKESLQNPYAVRHHSLGWNYRMSDLQAAVCLGQLENIDNHVFSRQAAQALFEIHAECSWLVPQTASYENEHAGWSAAFRMENAPVSWDGFRERFLANGGDPFYACWLSNYMEPVFQKPTTHWHLCPIAEDIQPNIIAFKTNYSSEEAIEQAHILERTIQSL